MQVYYTAAFVHVVVDAEVYVKMPKRFAKAGKALQLKKLLYGLQQSLRNFFSHLKDKLELPHIGFKQSASDPCLFISEKVLCLVYVDDTLLFSPKQEYIDDVISKLKAKDMTLETESDVAGFLGVNIDCKRRRNNHNDTKRIDQKNHQCS